MDLLVLGVTVGLMVGLPFFAYVKQSRRTVGDLKQRITVLTAAPATLPKYWVGVSTYEGDSEADAKAAFAALQDQLHTLPGRRELMQGDRCVASFKVV